MNKKYQISIVIPVYNNRSTIEILCTEIVRILNKNNFNNKFNIILVNDGSTDDSWDIIKRLHLQNPEIFTLINLTKNFGQIPALLSGLSHCDSQCTISMSADLQDTPEIIPKMINAWLNGSKFVIANRKSRDDGFVYNIISNLAWYLIRTFVSKDIPKNGFDYFLIDQKINDYYIKNSDNHTFIQGLLLSYGEKPFLIDYDRKKSEKIKSETSRIRRLKYFMDGLFGYSFLPLRLLTLVGAVVFVITVFYSLYVLIMYFKNGSVVTGWASLIISISFLNGSILMGLGILGEYLSRLITEVRNKPKYIIKEIIN